MGGDYSRDRFDVWKRYHGVLMQQGRVQLDADWNEQVAIDDRRWRAETTDVIGRCGVPEETPDGFKIEIDASGDLTIGRGRMYVHGFMAENAGAEPLEFDHVLEEQRGTAPLPFDDQPFYPTADQIEPLAGRHLVFLDVWRREVTYLEDPGVVEQAVGVDTTSRWQTAWKVDILEDVGDDVTCETPDANIDDWLDHIRPSAGRLTTDEAPVTADEGPCVIPPTGGYRGLENRLYRVEIHDGGAGGAAGTATFKWSRHNGVVATAVTALPDLHTLRVVRTQRDPVLRFSSGDWVEVTDDWRELAGLPGMIRQVATVNDGTNTIILTDDLPSGEFPTSPQHLTDPERHTRVRRWDQSGEVRDTDGTLLVDLDAPGAGGVIPVPAAGTSLVLEDGVQITFDVDPAIGDEYRVGDFWVFATRTADSSVEKLDNEPPDGIHHHYCRLAVVDSDGDSFIGTPLDCRPDFPPLTDLGPGCCTVVVEVGDDIQAAIDSLPAAGGCICLKTGTHLVDQELRISGSNVVLHGESPQTFVRVRGGVRVLVVEHPEGDTLYDITVDSVRFQLLNEEQLGKLGVGAIELVRCERVRIASCWLEVAQFDLLTGIMATEVDDLLVEGCVVENVAVGLWTMHGCREPQVQGCTFMAVDKGATEEGLAGLRLQDADGECRIDHNGFRGFREGIVINNDLSGTAPYSSARGSSVVGNTILRLGPAGEDDGIRLYGIDVAAPYSTVRGNMLRYASSLYGGIRVAAGGCLVEDNALDSRFRAGEGAELPVGIMVGFADDEVEVASDECSVRGNRLEGRQDAIWVDRSADTEVLANRIEGGATGLRYAIVMSEASRARIAGNRIHRSSHGIWANGGSTNRVIDNHLRDGGFGLSASSQAGLQVESNRLENLEGWGFFGYLLSGMTSVTTNRFASCGYGAAPGGPGFAIGVLFELGELQVESCQVLDTGVSQDGTRVAQPAFGIIGLLVLECRVDGNLVTYSNPLLARDFSKEDRALLLWGLLEIELTDVLTLGTGAQVLGNKFIGPGASALVEFLDVPLSDTINLRFERLFFSNNYCFHWITADQKAARTVVLRGRSANVIGNHIKASLNVPSVDFSNIRGVFVGNDTIGGTVNFAQFPTPESNFNH